MQIHYWPLSRVSNYARALRRNEQAIDRMVASIKEFGFKIPLLARSSGEVIDGDLRLKAAKKLGMAEVPVILCDEWSEAQVKAFRLLVNRSATWATWDMDLVALEMAELQALDFNLDLTGFDYREVDGLLSTGKDSASSDGGSTAAAVISKSGDLWTCGSHRILCGDCTIREVVARLYGSATPVLMVTDPPYGVDYDPTWRQEADLGQQRQTGKVANDHRADWTDVYRLFPGDVAYVWHAGVHASTVAAGLDAAGFRIRAQIIWVKQHFALSRGDYHWQHEPCWYAVREGKSSNWCGDRKQSTVWEVENLNPFGGNREDRATGHGTQKPLEVMRRPILNHTERGEIVFDPFLGSGTTLVAAQTSERFCFGLEINPSYVDMAVRRWQELTGKQAILDGDGRTFEEIAKERLTSTEVLDAAA